MPFICHKCNKEFIRNDVYKKHLNKKNSCIPPVKIDITLAKMQKEIDELKSLISSQNSIKI